MAENEGKREKEEITTPLFAKKEDDKKKRPFLYFLAWLPVLLIAIDQISKWLVVKYVSPLTPSSVEVIPHFFYITLTYNKGSSFGMGGDIPWMRYVYIVISWAASAGMLVYGIRNWRKRDTFIDILLSFCLAGAVGNGIDRTFYWEGTVGFSGVIDFFQFYIFGYGEGKSSFAIFNVADMYLTCAIFVLIVLLIYREIKDEKKTKEIKQK